MLGTFHPFVSGYRFAGTMHPNFQAWNDAILVLLAMSYFPERGVHAAPKIVIFLFGFCFLLLTNSRTALICIAVAVGFWCIVRSVILASSGIRSAFICFGFLAALAMLFEGSGVVSLGNLIEALLGTQRDEGDIGTLTGRVDVWEACLRLAGDRLTFGFGYDGFWDSGTDPPNLAGEPVGYQQAHSAYLDQALSTGVVGVTLYVATLFFGVIAAVRRFWQSQSETTLVIGTILVFCIIHGLTEFDLDHSGIEWNHVDDFNRRNSDFHHMSAINNWSGTKLSAVRIINFAVAILT